MNLSFISRRTSHHVVAPALGALLLGILAACGVPPGASSGQQTAQVTPTVTPLTTTSPVRAADECPPAASGWPDFTASIIGGLVLLPPRTRVIMTDNAPGAAAANLCTIGMTTAQIDQAMKTNLAGKGWHYEGQAGQWTNGDVLTFSYTLPDPHDWTVECQCGGIVPEGSS